MDILHYALIIKLKTSMVLNNMYTYFIGTKQINTLSNNKTDSSTYLYFIYQFMTFYINHLKNIRSYFNVNTNKMQIVKYSYEGDRHFIISGNNLSFKDIKYDYDEKIMNKRIFTKFNLINNQEKTCLKDLIIKYQDVNNKYQHTLENIFTFNNIVYDEKSQIELSFFHNKKMKNLILPYSEVKDQHINYFNTIE